MAQQQQQQQQLLVLLVLLVMTSSSICLGEVTQGACRCLPLQPCWPTEDMWQAFNASIDGVLMTPKPPASPCHDPHYDPAACKLVTEKWNDAFWRSDQPGALQACNMESDGTNSGCMIGDNNRSGVCAQGAIPMYAVNVSSPLHVQRTIEFAGRYNLRLVIKNTGHDFSGRNTAVGSLSLWMHHLKDISFSDSFTPVGCAGKEECREEKSSSSNDHVVVKIGAGVQWQELYEAVHNHNRTIVGAQCVSVGSGGGYPQGGGHSQLSPTFGLAADNVVQYEVVTADGKFVVVNSCENKDLFWAMRGGGGGTFGVVTSVTYLTHPPLQNLLFASYFITSNTSEGFRNLLRKFIWANVGLSDAGWGGFFILGNPQSLIIQYLLPNRDTPFAQKSLEPLLTAIQSPGIAVNGKIQEFKSYYDWHRAVQCSATGCAYKSGASIVEASRLIPRRVVENLGYRLADVLIEIQEQGYQRVSGYLVGGGKVSKPKQSNAVNPAWRTALLHVLIAKTFKENETMEGKVEIRKQVSDVNGMLREMSPYSGSYMNEGDANEPNWQQSFFGMNYGALKAIKTRVDPFGLFVCKNCVGSEDWSEDLNCKL